MAHGTASEPYPGIAIDWSQELLCPIPLAQSALGVAWAFMADTTVIPQYWSKGQLSIATMTFTLQRVAESGKKLGKVV